MNRGAQSLLKVQGLSKRFGGLTAVDELEIHVDTGEILGLIGPNGAGKTTTFNLIAGRIRPTSGSIRLAGEPISGLLPHEIARRGIMRTFQHNMPFAGMSVTDNVLVGAHTKLQAGLWSTIVGTKAGREAEQAARKRAEDLVALVGLWGCRDADVTTLSFGQGRLLETARGLAGEPRLMLFDEPAAGLTPAECGQLAQIIHTIAGRGIAVLLIEHDMRFLMPLADRVVVLNFGRKIADGTPDRVCADAAVRNAYLGTPMPADPIPPDPISAAAMPARRTLVGQESCSH